MMRISVFKRPLFFILVSLWLCSISLSLFSSDDGALGNGEYYFRLYCGRCHGAEDRVSGSFIYLSKKSLSNKYDKSPKKLLNRLINIDRYTKSQTMISAVHKIEDRQVLIKIVTHLASTDDASPPKEPEKQKGI